MTARHKPNQEPTYLEAGQGATVMPQMSESLIELIQREGNVFRLLEHQRDAWVFDIGIRARAEDLESKFLPNVQLITPITSSRISTPQQP